MKSEPLPPFDARRLLLLIAVCALGLFGWDWPVMIPFKLLAVAAHETGHALAALIVGGSVNQITVRLNESGECLSSLPPTFLAKVAVYSGGYLGTAIIGALLLIFTWRFNARRIVLGAACIWLTVIGLLYARDAVTLAFCAGMAVLFGAGARLLPAGAVGGLNLILAAFISLYAAYDFKSDLWGEGRAHSDAGLLSDVTVVPAIVWAAIWSFVGLLILTGGVVLAMRGGKKQSGLSVGHLKGSGTTSPAG